MNVSTRIVMYIRQRLIVIIYMLIMCFPAIGWALEQNEKLWLALNNQHYLSADKKYLSFIYTQLRLINQSHPIQLGLIEGGIGYRYLDHHSVWVGYRWSGIRPNDGFYQENRIFQQIISIVQPDDLHQFIFRSRLEEIEHTNQSQISLRLRERIAMEIKKSIMHPKLFPFYYEELFFQLNHTQYTPSKFISQNRLFLGFNLYAGNETWWEIGYLNQFQIHTPSQFQNQMSHIISITYSYF